MGNKPERNTGLGPPTPGGRPQGQQELRLDTAGQASGPTSPRVESPSVAADKGIIHPSWMVEGSAQEPPPAASEFSRVSMWETQPCRHPRRCRQVCRAPTTLPTQLSGPVSRQRLVLLPGNGVHFSTHQTPGQPTKTHWSATPPGAPPLAPTPRCAAPGFPSVWLPRAEPASHWEELPYAAAAPPRDSPSSRNLRLSPYSCRRLMQNSCTDAPSR